LERDDFEKRLKAGIDIGNHEILYPMMQAYDSLILDIDLEVEGSDQKFNVHAGRELQRKMGKSEQDILLVSLLVGLDGKEKMSKSSDNYIGVAEGADSQYGKTMSIPDKLLPGYFELLTDLHFEEKNSPRDEKMRLAYEIVKNYHGEKETDKAQENFIKLFQKKEIPDNIPEIKVKKGEELSDILMENKIIDSKSELRRLIKEGAIDVDGKNIKDAHHMIEKEVIVKIGKKKFIKIII
jgi:tyrosyl-tRNA synthetase